MILPFRIRWLTVVLILLFSRVSFAQMNLTDSLRLLIPKETNDTNKIKLLIRLALLINVGQEEMTECLKQVNDLSRKNLYRPGLIYGRYYEGLVMWDNNHLDSAFEKIKSSIDGLDSLHIIQLMNNSPLHMMRLLFYDMGKQTERFQYYLAKAAFYRKYGPIVKGW